MIFSNFIHRFSPQFPLEFYLQANVVAQQISPPQPQYQQPYQNQQQQQQQQYQQQPTFMGTPLRKEAPITQKPAPVYQSQPGATSFQGKQISKEERFL